MTDKQPGKAAASARAAAGRPIADGRDGAEATPGEREGVSERGTTAPEQGGPEQAERGQPGRGQPERGRPHRGRADAAQPRHAEPSPGEGSPVEGQPGEGQPADDESHERLLEHDLDELAARAEKADEYLVLAQRTRADFENYRKRATREAALAQERGVARLAKELLPALDNLDRAVQAAATPSDGSTAPGDEADSQLVSGIRLVQADLLAALARTGIEPFSPIGEAFDPQWHEAVAQLPVEGSQPGTVVEVYQQGYRLGDAVLRPARVLVAA